MLAGQVAVLGYKTANLLDTAPNRLCHTKAELVAARDIP